MRIKFFFLIFILSMAGSCNRTNDELRDRIVFNDNIDTVQNAMLRIITYMDSLPAIAEDGGISQFYVIHGDYLQISGFPKRKINNSILPGLTSKSRSEFIQLVLFLKRNFITSVYKTSNNTWFYDYRAFSNPDSEDPRDIVLNRNFNDTVGVYVENKIIDQEKNLLLLAPKSREEVLKNYNEIENKNKNERN